METSGNGIILISLYTAITLLIIHIYIFFIFYKAAMSFIIQFLYTLSPHLHIYISCITNISDLLCFPSLYSPLLSSTLLYFPLLFSTLLYSPLYYLHLPLLLFSSSHLSHTGKRQQTRDEIQ